MTWPTSERSPARRRPNGSAYEVHWRDGDRKMQRTFTVKREAERFALKVEAAKDAGDTTRSLVKNTARSRR